MLLHHILLYPVMTLPTPIRLIIFFSIRLFIRSARPTLGDVEFGDLPSTATEKNAEITNEINILSHLEEATNTNKNTSTHYTDMLHSVRSMPGFGLPSHFDFLAERYCGGKEKTKYECWACGNVVCEVRNSECHPLPISTFERAKLDMQGHDIYIYMYLWFHKDEDGDTSPLLQGPNGVYISGSARTGIYLSLPYLRVWLAGNIDTQTLCVLY